MNKQSKIAVIVLNWNGVEDSLSCVAALQKQSLKHTVIAVDNGSDDSFSTDYKQDSTHILLQNMKNEGFAGGVNTGLRYALQHGFDWVALINNDATPDSEWLSELVNTAKEHPNAGIVTGKLLQTTGLIDSTGDQYTSWGLAYPRGRNEKNTNAYTHSEEVFAATGGASLYSRHMLEQIGLFDEDFFAYYEDVDISFRARLAGWKIIYEPKAIAHHKVGASSSKVPGFTTYMTIKNLPWLLIKNVPLRLLPTVFPRFFIAHAAIVFSSLAKGAVVPVLKGLFMTTIFMPKKLLQRWKIQKESSVDYLEIMSHMTYDLPPNASKLRRVRSILKKLRFWR